MSTADNKPSPLLLLSAAAAGAALTAGALVTSYFALRRSSDSAKQDGSENGGDSTAGGGTTSSGSDLDAQLGVDPLHTYDPQRAARLHTSKPLASFDKDFAPGTRYVTRVVLTGGPCGGKSSSLAHLTRALTAHGFDVLCVPEVPTILLNGGCVYPGTQGDPQKLLHFETAVVRAQLQLERSFVRVAASTGRPTVVVCDRGLPDVAAYVPESLWNQVLRVNEITQDEIMQRYDLVLHLVTAADGAEKFYTTTNNTARSETPQEARELDLRIQACYAAHPKLKIVDNATDFAGKLQKATQFVVQQL